MVNLLFAAAILLVLGSCDQDEKRKKKECEALDADIYAELARINHCTSDYDCRNLWVSNRFGCSVQHNKTEDTGQALALIDEYAHGQCWDGSVTLLDCAMVTGHDLSCEAGVCDATWASSGPRSKAIFALDESRKIYDASDYKSEERTAAYDRCKTVTLARSGVEGHEEEPEYGYAFTFEVDELGLLKTCARETRGCRDGVIPCEAQDSSSSEGS